MILTHVVTNSDRDRTVHSIMRKELRISATMMRRLKLADAISVSDILVFTNYRLTPGEIVKIDIMAAEQPCDNLPEQGDIDILFENDGLLAVNKPVGILVHPSRSRHMGTLSNFVAGYLGRGDGSSVPFFSCSNSPPNFGTEEPSPRPTPTCHAVNRLDRDTSGVVLFAKNSYMKALASEALCQPDVKKEYLALVYGSMPRNGTIDVPIKRKEELNMFRIPATDGQRAVTHYETVKVFGENKARYSLVKFNLETGRTHQIRVHCLHLGHPILGDKLYCNEQSTKLSQKLAITTQALHAKLLGFTEPLSEKHIEITAKAPFLSQENSPCNFPKDMLPY